MLALLLDRIADRRIESVLRAMYFLPTVTSLVVVALVFSNLYARDGYLNLVLGVARGATS